ncbi:ATP-binding cassette domain-containing protein [Georgenia yuyongxinii]|uniref:ATP-binding cassette domain-containing protein n=1 Tax=Georgenia yuyongxinii TaxID=2589797 RepID=A0A552WUU4_9MICO|nr:ATP-binding cassette domain-containing protein [Georgenia yuyongxinii]TRW46562.1 ATP-binding cassette domain-containing protein [Georgenia yuyongxinii]
MIEIRDLTKVYGSTTAVDHLTVTVRPGVVTGFLGPNGAGKSTTMRAVLGLDRPTAGEVLVAGRPFAEHPDPLRTLGALLDAGAVHPARTAHRHLTALARSNGIGPRRVEEVIDLVGLGSVAHRRARTFSLGMSQRLGIAAALLGDPPVIMLDEPVNGLDPDGIRWIRTLLRSLAAEGRTVFVSSHLMSEMALTADHLIVLGRGRLIADVPLADLTSTLTAVRVRTPDGGRLAAALTRPGVTVTPADDAADDAGAAHDAGAALTVTAAGARTDHAGALTVTGADVDEIAAAALADGVLVTELTPLHDSLEDAYLALTRDDIEYSAQPATTSKALR